MPTSARLANEKSMATGNTLHILSHCYCLSEIFLPEYFFQNDKKSKCSKMFRPNFLTAEIGNGQEHLHLCIRSLSKMEGLSEAVRIFRGATGILGNVRLTL
jgi:hypothetical protein